MSPVEGTTPRLLLVEDDTISAQFLSAALAALPAWVEIAASCAQAIALSARFDLWLIDANLPDGTGVDLLRRMRATAPDTAALAHTADPSPALRRQLLQAGFADVLVKPLTAAQLQQAVRDALGLPGHGGGDTAADWDESAALAALGGNREHAELLRQLFLAELPGTRDACLAAFARSDHATLQANLHKLRASCAFAGTPALAALAAHWHAEPHDPALRDAFDRAVARLLPP